MNVRKSWLSVGGFGAALLIGFVAGRLAPGRDPVSSEPLVGEPPAPAAQPRYETDNAVDAAAPLEEAASARAAVPGEPHPLEERRTEGIDSVIGLMSVPGDFAQTAALYALAGRADAEAIKRYIDEAKGIGIVAERAAALHILYLRFSELDPEACIEHLYASGLAGRYNLVFAIFNGWAKFDLDAAIARIDRLRGAAERQVAGEAILQAHANADAGFIERLAERLPGEWSSASPRSLAVRAQTDPAGALGEALSLAGGNTRTQALLWIANVWARADPQAALAHSDHIDDPNARREFRAAVLGRLAQQEPVEALAMLDTSTPGESQIILGAAVSTLARSDPQQAMALVQKLDDRQLRQTAMNILINGWASHDPRGAAAALSEFDDRELREQLGYSIVHHYVRAAPMEALAWAEQFEDRKGHLWNSAVNAIAREDPGQALELVAALEPSPQRAEVMSSILATMAASDPLLAVQFLEELPSGSFRHQAIAGIASNWVHLDPTAALEWVLSLPQSAQIQALSSVGYSMAAQDVYLAARYADRVPESARVDWISAVVQNYAGEDPAQAADWIEQFKELPEYGNWLGIVAAGFVARDPRAGALLISRVGNPDHYRQAQIHLAQTWAARDPAAAAKWWSNLPSERQDADVVQTVVGQWQHYQSDAAEKWVLRLRSNEFRDAGIQALIGRGMEAAEAERWIRRISSEPMREQAYSQQVMQLAHFDPDAARDLLARASVSAEARQRLEQFLDQDPAGVY